MTVQRFSVELADVRPLDWYDGSVTAVGICKSDSSCILGVLLAFFPDRKSRIYGLFEISRELYAELDPIARMPLHSRAQVPWDRVQRLVGQGLVDASGSLILAKCRPVLVDGVCDGCMRVNLESFRNRLTWSIEDANLPDRIEVWRHIYEEGWE